MNLYNLLEHDSEIANDVLKKIAEVYKKAVEWPEENYTAMIQVSSTAHIFCWKKPSLGVVFVYSGEPFDVNEISRYIRGVSE